MLIVINLVCGCGESRVTESHETGPQDPGDHGGHNRFFFFLTAHFEQSVWETLIHFTRNGCDSNSPYEALMDRLQEIVHRHAHASCGCHPKVWFKSGNTDCWDSDKDDCAFSFLLKEKTPPHNYTTAC